MSGKIYVINVGSNASHSFCSPIFSDQTFEFIPIPEDRQLPSSHGTEYRNLKSHYDPEQDLSSYIPKNMFGATVHSDPEFDTYTYGDNCEVNPRAMGMKNVARGDFLLFLSRLQYWEAGEPTDNFGFYFIGFIHVDQILRSVWVPPSDLQMERFNVNAHIRRGMADEDLWDGFWVFGGSSWSRRFYKAVPVTRNLCEQVFVAANGSPWEWKEKRTELQTIGSYTRSCRCAIDPAVGNGKARADILWDWVEKYSQ